MADRKRAVSLAAKYILAVTLTVALIPANASAQEAGVIELEKVTVTNRRVRSNLGEASENVQVINQDEIKQLPARDLSEALNYIPGVYIEPRRGFGRATSLSIQGSDSRQVRVMIDGIPLNTQASGQVNLAKFPIENIDRIEVIKGASSSIWGSSLGGVINIITKDTGNTLIPQGSLTNSFAEFRTRKESFDSSGKAADMGYYIFSSYMESGGKGAKDDILEKKAFAKLSYDLKEMGKVAGSFGFSQAEVNSGELPDKTWEANPYRCQYGKVGWSKDFNAVAVEVDLKTSRQDIISKSYRTVEDDVAWQTIRSRDVLYQVSAVSSMRPGENDLLVVGADFDWNILKSTYLTTAKELTAYAPYLNYTLKLNPWDWNFGLRYDHNSEFGQEASPSLGCVYHLYSIANSLIRANLSRAFNAPPLLWKYYERVVGGGLGADNPGIGPERGWVYELGLESQPIPEFWLKISLYRADVSDALSNARNSDGKWIKKNFKKFRRQGLELESKLELFKGFSFKAAGSFNDIEDRASGKTVQDADSPRQSFDLGFEYAHQGGFGFYINGRYDYWNKTFDTFRPEDRKFILDLKARQKFKHYTCFLNIYNLANTKFWSDYFFPSPGRYFEGGVTIKW